jgi:hypothetical protein
LKTRLITVWPGWTVIEWLTRTGGREVLMMVCAWTAVRCDLNPQAPAPGVIERQLDLKTCK